MGSDRLFRERDEVLAIVGLAAISSGVAAVAWLLVVPKVWTLASDLEYYKVGVR